jgi:hypothetical protein
MAQPSTILKFERYDFPAAAQPVKRTGQVADKEKVLGVCLSPAIHKSRLEHIL